MAAGFERHLLHVQVDLRRTGMQPYVTMIIRTQRRRGREDGDVNVSMQRPTCTEHQKECAGDVALWKYTLLSLHAHASCLLPYITSLCNQRSRCEAQAALAVDGQR